MFIQQYEINERMLDNEIYCKTNSIPLLRIPYTTPIKEIEEKLYEYYLSLTTAGCA